MADDDDSSNFGWIMLPGDVYDTDFRKKIVQEFNIGIDEAEEFFCRLESAVLYAKGMAINNEERPSEKAIRDSWSAISSTAEKLLNEIEKANHVLENGLVYDLGWHLLEQDQEEYLMVWREPDSLEELDEQHATVDRYTANGNEIVEAVKKFAQLTKAITNDLPPSKRGPKSNDELWFWVQSVSYAWEKALGRKFTRDVDDRGEPISEAARFVAMVTERTPYEKTKALNMMKKVISSSRKTNFH